MDLSLEPTKCAINTLEPTDSPMNRFVNRLINDDVEPTAASDASPAKFPTTIMSQALNNSCRMPDKITGTENIIIFRKVGPDTIFE